MGRFYQTADPHFVDDAMFKLPWELMGTVLEKKEKDVDDTIKTATDYLAKLDAKVLDYDKPEYAKIRAAREAEVGNIVSNIMADPSAYMQQQAAIRETGRKIATDWGETGKVGSMGLNFAARMAEEEAAKKTLEKDPDHYDDEYVKAKLAESLAGYKGVDYKGPGEYAKYAPGTLTGMEAPNKWVDDRMKDFKVEGNSVERDTTSGLYFYRHKNEKKYIDPQDVRDYLEDAHRADVNQQKATMDRAQLGLPGYEGYLDEQGAAVAPISYDKKGQPIYARNPMGQAFSGGVNKYAFMDEATSDTMRANEVEQAALKRRQDLEDKPQAEVIINQPVTELFTGKTWSADKFNASVKANNKLATDTATAIKTFYDKLSDADKKAYGKDILAGNAKAMVAAGMDEGTAGSLAQNYEDAAYNKKIEKVTANAFYQHLIKNGNKEMAAKLQKPGWNQDAEVMKEYDNYLGSEKGSVYHEAKADMSWEGIKGPDGKQMSPENIKKIQTYAKDNFEHFKLDIGSLASSKDLVFTDKNGNQIQYINPHGTIISGTTRPLTKAYADGDKNKVRQYKQTDPGGFSIAQMINDGIVTRTFTYDKETKKNIPSYTMIVNGKATTLNAEQSSFAPIHSVDDNDNTNYGVNVTAGNQIFTAKVPTTELDITGVNQFYDENRKGMRSDKKINQINWNKAAGKVRYDGEVFSFSGGDVFNEKRGIRITDERIKRGVRKAYMETLESLPDDVADQS